MKFFKVFDIFTIITYEGRFACEKGSNTIPYIIEVVIFCAILFNFSYFLKTCQDFPSHYLRESSFYFVLL